MLGVKYGTWHFLRVSQAWPVGNTSGLGLAIISRPGPSSCAEWPPCRPSARSFAQQQKYFLHSRFLFSSVFSLPNEADQRAPSPLLLLPGSLALSLSVRLSRVLSLYLSPRTVSRHPHYSSICLIRIRSLAYVLHAPPLPSLRKRPPRCFGGSPGQAPGGGGGAAGRCSVFSKSLWRKQRLSGFRAQKRPY